MRCGALVPPHLKLWDLRKASLLGFSFFIAYEVFKLSFVGKLPEHVKNTSLLGLFFLQIVCGTASKFEAGG